MLIGGLCACRNRNTVSVLYFAVPNTAGTFDPQIASDITARIVVRNCFEGLVYVGETGGAEPGAASAWRVSENGLTYTFTLRPGQKWHVTSNAMEALAGKLPENFSPEVTADDFVFALQRAVDPATGAPNAGLLMNVEHAAEILAGEAAPETLGVRAAGPYTLEIRLARPQANFLQVLSEPLCMPCNRTFFTAAGGRYGLLIKYYLSNGPFYLSRFDDSSYRIAKNPDYAGPNAAITDIVWFYKQTDETALLANLKDGTYSGAYLSAAQQASLGEGRGITALPLRDILRCILLNPKVEALQNGDLRAAFFAATDRAAFCAEQGRTPAAHLYPAALGGGGQAAFPAYDEALAARRLSAALKALGENGVKYTMLCEPAYENALKKQLLGWQRTLGIHFNISVKPVSASELAAAVREGSYEMAFYPVTAPSLSPYAWFSQFTAGGANSVLPLESPAFSEAVSALSGADEAGLPAAFAAAERELISYNYVLPLWEESNYFVCTGGVTGVRVLPGNDRLYLQNAAAPKK